MMKRKALSAPGEAAADEAGAPPRIDDNLLAEEILPRLPVHAAAAACAAGSTLRGILTSPDYWRVRNNRPHLAAGPRAACIVIRRCDDGGKRFRHEFHYADAASSSPDPPAVIRSVSESPKAFHHAGTCNGLVLLAPSWDSNDRVRAVLFNPATGEEETIVVDMAGGDGNVFRCFCGIGYSTSSKAYKALVCATDFDHSVLGEPYSSGELLVVPLGGGGGCGGGGGQEHRAVATVAKMCVSFDEFPCSLSMEGKVYVLPAEHRASAVQAFNVDDETVTAIPLPPSAGAAVSELMEVWGRPCIATCDAYNSATLWVLTPEHRWERRCTLGVVSNYMCFASSEIHGAWDCGERLLFVLFRDGCGSTYDLRGTTPERVTTARDVPEEEEAAKASLPAELDVGSFCWGYQPTLMVVPLATVFGDGEFYLIPRPWCLEVLMEMMRKQSRPQHREETAAIVKNDVSTDRVQASSSS